MTGGRRAAYPERSGLTFSPDGRFATCLRTDRDGRTLEYWTLSDGAPVGRPVTELDVSAETWAAPLDDGRVVLVRRDITGAVPRYRVHLLVPTPAGFDRVPVGEFPAAAGCRLLAAPGPGRLAVAVAIDDLENSTIRQVLDPPRLEELLRVPGVLTGGARLAPDLLALDRTDGTSRTSGIVVDLARASWRQVWSVSERSADRIVLAHPGSGVMVLSTDATGRERLGWARLGDDEVRFPPSLNPPGGAHALALDDRGERLLVDEPAGVSSRLVIHSLAGVTAEATAATREGGTSPRPVPGPPCTVTGPASWTADLVRVLVSAPDRPPTLGTIRLGALPAGSPAGTEADGAADGAGPTGWSYAPLPGSYPRPPAAREWLPGATGRVEAVVLGAGWRRREHLVLALHGGPLSAWRFAFDPLLACLADAGIAVAATNYRGSTGYGDAHLRAVVGDWGGPDLDDVVAIGRDLARSRGDDLPRPVLAGASYGAYLALLAACREPELWSAVVALAPFTSPSGLFADTAAALAVRHRIGQLGGLRPSAGDEPHETRDVLRACDRLRARVLLVHGRDDRIVPVGQSRDLYRRLLAPGLHEREVEYLELDTDHTDVALARAEGLAETVRDFCLRGAVRGSTSPAA